MASRWAVLVGRRKSNTAVNNRQRHMAQSPTAKPVLVHHGILKGYVVSMAISVIYLAILMVAGAWIPYTYASFAFVTFVSTLVIVNVAVAAYYRKKNQAVWNYFVGVLIALGVDIWLVFTLLEAINIATLIAAA